jgi:hypothetical protein
MQPFYQALFMMRCRTGTSRHCHPHPLSHHHPSTHKNRFERKGFKLVGLKLYQTPKEVAEEHYKELKDKPFYPKLVEYIVSGPVVAMVRGQGGRGAGSRQQAGCGKRRGDVGQAESLGLSML